MSLTLTRKTDYALVALAALAEQQQEEGEPLSARQIAERHQLPLPLLMNLLKDLHKGKILCSRRGPSGGYLLCHDPGDVHLLDVIEAIEGTVKVALCCDEDNTDDACTACQVMAACPIVKPMQRFNDMLRGFLDKITLADLIDREASPLNDLKITGASS